jgi:hypothetical protein
MKERKQGAHCGRGSRRIAALNAMMGSPSVGHLTQRAKGCGYELTEGSTGVAFNPKTLAMAESVARAIVKRAQGGTNAT